MTGNALSAVIGGFELLRQLDIKDLVLFFWFTLIFELPRYLIGALVIFVRSLRGIFTIPEEAAIGTDATPRAFSVVVAGHNEATVLRKCVQSIHEQTIYHPDTCEILVIDDGSTDGMSDIGAEMLREGLIDVSLKLDLRGGKSAAINLGLQHCRHEYLAIIDVDTTFDRDAFAHIMARFEDPKVGAVCGNLFVRNAHRSLTTAYQDVEYLISISLGRRVSEMLDLLGIVSGAFGAFRRSALESVGGYDVEIGEDADLTMKLRSAGYRIVFEPRARAGTDVPETVTALIRQRLRWDRSVVTIWWRKYNPLINPFRGAFSISNAAIIFDVVFLQILVSCVFFIYLVWLITVFGWFAIAMITATLVVYFFLSVAALLMAAVMDGRKNIAALLLQLPYYVLFGCFVMRFIRLYAALEELVFLRSYHDPYVPRRVMKQVERY